MEPQHTQWHWRRSSRCILPDNSCVEVSVSDDQHRVRVRDSKIGNETILTFNAGSWNDFLAAVKAGEFDLD